MFFTIKLYLYLICVLVLNWIVWNWIIFIKMDLALNSLQRFICHKTQTTNQSSNSSLLWHGGDRIHRNTLKSIFASSHQKKEHVLTKRTDTIFRPRPLNGTLIFFLLKHVILIYKLRIRLEFLKPSNYVQIIFPSSRLVAIPKLKTPVCPTLHPSNWRENCQIHTFPTGMWNAASFSIWTRVTHTHTLIYIYKINLNRELEIFY